MLSGPAGAPAARFLASEMKAIQRPSAERLGSLLGPSALPPSGAVEISSGARELGVHAKISQRRLAAATRSSTRWANAITRAPAAIASPPSSPPEVSSLVLASDA